MVTLEVFNSSLDIRLLILKDMLEESGIGYITTNEVKSRGRPLQISAPDNMAIELRVYEENLEKAREILASIK